MEFNIQRDIFLEGIQKTLGIVEKKTTMPMLNNLLLRAENDRIVIMATDLEVGMVYHYETDVVREGEITVSARKLYEMVREIQGDTIHVVKNDKNVVIITSHKAVYRILGLPSEDYPVVDKKDHINFYPVNGTVFMDLLRKTAFSISTDEMRKNLMGVLMETEQVNDACLLRFISTDGHRLSFASSSNAFKGGCLLTEGLKNIIIPKKGVGEILRLFEDTGNEAVFVGVEEGVFAVKSHRTFLRVSLIDADYPDYRRVIPSENGTVIPMHREDLLHAIRRMCVISSEKYNGVIMMLSYKKVSFHSINNDIGEANDEIAVDYEGNERNIGYNVRYLSDAIEAIDEEIVDMEIHEDMRPTIIRGKGNDHYFCIIMPLKI